VLGQIFRPAVVACAVSLLCATRAAAWGSLGHSISAAIAYGRLTPTAKARVDRLLSQEKDEIAGPSFVTSSIWADRFRFESEFETSQWHVASYPLSWQGDFSSCPPFTGPGYVLSGCVVSKVFEFHRQLSPPPKDPRLIVSTGFSDPATLKFLVHFIQDIHQPLHVSDNNDFNGNCVQIKSPRDLPDTNLHAYWDVSVVRSLGSDPTEIAARLSANIGAAEADAWTTEARTSADAKSWISAWTRESHGLAVQVYGRMSNKPGCQPSGELSADYASAAQRLTELQLQKSGVRVAFVLNRLFDPPRRIRAAQ